jgi:hypothetical protein
MRGFMKSVLQLFYVLSGLLLLISCQEEESTIVQDQTQNLSTSSPLSKAMTRVTQNNTSVDNILDETSVFVVKLPVSITLNNVNLTVSSVSDYATIQSIKEVSNSDDDIVNYTFPIQVGLRNYQEIVINSTSQLNSVISANDDISEISCLSIQYPITINEYDSSNQIANVITFISDSQVINYLINLSSSVFYSINYPISVLDPSNQIVAVTSNSQFIDLIEFSISQCGTNSGSTDTFISVITSGTWRVTYYFDDEEETADYQGYVFTFNANNTITVVKNAITYTGTWSFYEDDGVDVFEINFADSELSELADDWELLEFSNTVVELKDDGNDEYLTFTKN